MELNQAQVVIGIINGMIGGVILVLPLLALDAGMISTAIILPISGLFSYYSCHLCVKHLGQQKDLDYALLKHFNGSKIIKIGYDLIVFINLLFILVLYFELIVQQWEGLLITSPINPIANSIILLCLIFILRYYDFGASIMAYGIISIIGYCIFLIWMLASSPAGSKQVQIFGKGSINLASAMGQAFSVQTFFIPVLKRNSNSSKYFFFTLLAYLAGTFIYLYIAFMGSFGLLNRISIKENPQTVEDYFSNGTWEVSILQIIYLIHLYSVYPQFLLVSKKRVFSAFGLPGIEIGKISIYQIIYTLGFLAICLIISLIGINIDIIIQINGAVIGFFFIYLIPLILHIKCIYINDEITKIQEKDANIEIFSLLNQRSQESINNLQSSLLTQNYQNKEKIYQKLDNKITTESVKSNCKAEKPKNVLKLFDICMLIGMMSVGLFIMVDGIYSLFK